MRMASLLSNALVVLFINSFRFAVIFGHRCLDESSCLYQSCSMDSDCSVNEVCCSGMCQHGSDCLGKSCSTISDCSVGQCCCSNVCKCDCSGYLPCSWRNNCSVGQYCWEGVCTNNVYGDDPVFIPLVVVSSLVGFFIVLMFIYYCYRRARLGRPGRVQMERQVTTTVVTTTQPATQASPQAHQHGYPYQSLPQNDQYQNAAPPPYSGRMVTGSDLPPPYNSRTQRKPDGGHTSPPTYGSLQST